MHRHGNPAPRWVWAAWAALAALLLYLPHTAGAVTVAEDLALAEAYWGEPPPGCMTTEAIMVPSLNNGDAVGEATQPRYGEHIPCMMRVSEKLGVRELCIVVIHEYGHWLGLPHSDDPTNPMYPVANFQRIGLCIEQWLGIRWQRCLAMPHSPRRHHCFVSVFNARSTLPTKQPV